MIQDKKNKSRVDCHKYELEFGLIFNFLFPIDESDHWKVVSYHNPGAIYTMKPLDLPLYCVTILPWSVSVKLLSVCVCGHFTICKDDVVFREKFASFNSYFEQQFLLLVWHANSIQQYCSRSQRLLLYSPLCGSMAAYPLSC